MMAGMDLLLTLHKAQLVAGSFGLALAVIALGVPKGERAHVLAGRTFLALAGAGQILALVLATWAQDLFLGLNALFTLYLGVTGWRWTAPGAPGRLDRALSGGALVGSVGMGLTALGALAGMRMETLSPDDAPVALGFAALGIVVARRNLGDFESEPLGIPRRQRHAGHMIGAAILFATAFCVAAFRRLGLPDPIARVAPVVVLGPVLIYWLRRTAPRA